jgi:hypothetical protein
LRERLGKLLTDNQNIEGGTLYIFENHKNNDFSLPKKSYCGRKMIGPKGRFTGDAYFLTFVKSGDLRMLEVIKPPEAPKPLNESTEVNMEKLILDQPEKFTNKGQTEQVVVNNPQAQKLTEVSGETTAKQPTGDVLLVEHPMAGIDIIS